MSKGKSVDENQRTLQKWPVGRRVRFVGEPTGHVVGYVEVGELLEVRYLNHRTGQTGQFNSRSPKFTPAPGPLVLVGEADRIIPPSIQRKMLLKKWQELPKSWSDEELEFMLLFAEAWTKQKHRETPPLLATVTSLAQHADAQHLHCNYGSVQIKAPADAVINVGDVVEYEEIPALGKGVGKFVRVAKTRKVEEVA